ncbi:MAG: ribonuclease HI [Gemmatimonadetes bacterium]|nr:MAG: ribonuclease HI [Gemmatimonadota bacterium]
MSRVMARELITIYADESCLGNGREGENPGGAGALVEYRRAGSDEIVRRDLWLSERGSTNNRMALRSVTASLDELGVKGATFNILFTTDSRYIVDGMTDWVHGWARRGWTRKSGAIENLGLWADAIAAARAHVVQWQWVRGHNGHAQNEYANHLATRAAADQTQSGGLVPSGFEAWDAAARARGAKHAPPSAFLDVANFRPHAELPEPPE